MNPKDAKRTIPFFFVFIVCCVSNLSAAGVQDAPPPLFRAGVELVRLDVRVTDAQGHPVRDLRQNEVEVVEGGASRPVVFFQHVEEPHESYAAVASRTVGGEVSTNHGAARGHLYVMLFDEIHIAPGGEQRVRLAVERFLKTRIQPGDRVALYALPGPGPHIGFTADIGRLLAELPKVRGTAEPQAVGATGTMSVYEAYQILLRNELILQRVTDRNAGMSPTSDTQRHTDQSTLGTSMSGPANTFSEDAERIVNVADGETRVTLSALSAILRQMRTIEGRKTVLLVSEGFYGARLSREIQNVAAAAAESYSVVQAFDVNRHDLDASADESANADQANAIRDKLAPLGSLAVETGGSLVVDASRHADEALAAIAERSQDYYLVGFTPASDGRERGAYRPVTIRVTRRGAQVSTRTGFTLTDLAAKLDRHQSIERAIAAPFAQQALPLEYTTYVLHGSSSGMQRVIVSLAAELPLGGGDHAPSADVVFVVRSAADGHVAASGHDTLPLPSSHGQGETTGTGAYHVQFELAPGDYLMRAVVREPGGLVGSADRRFTVRSLDGPSLTSGDLVLSAEPGELPVRPIAYTGDGLSGVLELYGRTADQLRAARVSVDLVPVGEDLPVTTGSCDLLDLRTAPNGSASREARLDLPLQGIAPGPYVARARVMVGPDTAVETLREVEIRGGRRPATADASEEGAFDPRAISGSAVAQQFVARLTGGGSPAATDGQRALERLGARDYPSAVAALDAVLRAEPDNAEAAFLLGWAYHGAGDDRQAISAWRRAAYADPTLVAAHLALADIYVRLSQPALAVQALHAGLAALPQSPELLDRLSRLERK